jgi:hypothetical protein
MTPRRRNRLMTALEKEFEAKVHAELVGRPGRYRFNVASESFTKISHLARRDAIWKVVDQVPSPEASLDGALILAYAPVDLEVTR